MKKHPPCIPGPNLKSQISDPKSPLVLITGHRRENFGDGFENICQAIAQLARQFPDTHFVYPVHLNPRVREPVLRILGAQDNLLGNHRLTKDGSPYPKKASCLGRANRPGEPSLEHRDVFQRTASHPPSMLSNIHLIEPLDYLSFVSLMNRATLILTDSGGVQEEAPSLGKPVIVMRDTTERPEAVRAGTVKVVGTDTRNIVKEATALLTRPMLYRKMSTAHNPYGDGQAAGRIVAACQAFLKPKHRNP